MNKSVKMMPPNIVEMFQKYNWPGNVRELRNVIERMVVLSSNGEIDIDTLPEEIKDTLSQEKTEDALRTQTKAFEREYITKILKKNGGNVAKAAAEMQIAKKNLYRKLNDYDIKYKKNEI